MRTFLFCLLLLAATAIPGAAQDPAPAPAQPDPGAQPQPPAQPQPDEPPKPSAEEEAAYQGFRAQLHALNRRVGTPEDYQKLIDLARAFVETYPQASMVRRTSCILVAAQSLARLEQHEEVIKTADTGIAFVEDARSKQTLEELKGMAQLWLGRTGDAEGTLAAMTHPTAKLTESVQFARAIRVPDGRQPAADFTLKDITNDVNTVTLSGFKGRVVLVDFWATWCDPCLRLMEQHLKDLHTTYAARGLTVLSVGTKFRNETAEKQAALAKKAGFTWLKVFDPEGTVSDAWNVRTIPHLVLIDREGKVVLQGNGFSAMPFVRQFLETECPKPAGTDDDGDDE